MTLMIVVIVVVLLLLLVSLHGNDHESSSSLSSSSSSLSSKGVISCCTSSSSLSLISCVNESADINRHRVEHAIASGGGPSLGVAIVTYSTNSIFDYASYSFAINEAYAEHNGYIMKLLDDTSADDEYDKEDPRWNKVKILERAIDPVGGNHPILINNNSYCTTTTTATGWAKDLDYVMWVDADLVFLDMNMRIEQIAASYPKAHILVSAENHGSTTLINSGSIIIKNSKWSRQFLSLWWSWSSRRHYSDQEQFDMLYQARRKVDRLDDYIAILPPDAINSDPPAFARQKDHNQVLHLMGEHSGFRIKAFSSAFNEICRYAEDASVTRALAPQLTATRDNMLLWTLEEYGKEYKELIKFYSIGAESGQYGISESRKLSNSVHHYAHALFISGQDKSLAENLRIKVFHLLSKNMEARRPKNEEIGRAHV